MIEKAAISSATLQTKIAQLVWLGAGNATQPANLIAQASKTVLVEARAQAYSALVQQFAGHSNITVLNTLLSEHGGEVSFIEYNLAEFSALHTSSGLSVLFPGLKLVKTQQQHSETLADLLQPLALSGDNNAVVIDIADISLLLLKQLQAANLLAHFSQLYVQSSAEALYQGAATQGEIIQWLQQQGYSLSTQDNTDPDLPWLQFSLNPLWQRLQQSCDERDRAEQANTELTKQLEQVKQLAIAEKQQAEQAKAVLTEQLEQVKQHAIAEKQLAEQAKAGLAEQLEQVKQQAIVEKQQAEQAKAGLAEQLEQVKLEVVTEQQQAEENNKKSQQQILEQQHQFEQKLAELNTKLVNNTFENETLQQQLNTARATIEKKQTELNGLIAGKDAELKQALQQLATANQQISSATEQVNKLQHELAERDSQLVQFEATKAQLQQQLKQETEWNQKHKSWAESLKTQNEQLNKELKEQQRSSQLGIKLLAKVEADASELRERYAMLLTTEQELRNLVGELYIKLSAASKFYNKLEQDHPELLEKKP